MIELNGKSKFDFMKKIMSIFETQINTYLVNDLNNYQVPTNKIKLPDKKTWPFVGMCIETIYSNLIIKIHIDDKPIIKFGLCGGFSFKKYNISDKDIGDINGIIQLLATNMPDLSFNIIRDEEYSNWNYNCFLGYARRKSCS